MKISLFSLFALILMSLASSCSKQGGVTPAMSATINGANFSAFGTARVNTSILSATQVTVTGVNYSANSSSKPTSIAFTITNSSGTQTVSSGQVFAAFSSDATGGLPVNATSGQVTVTTSTAHELQGTFSFTFADSNTTFTVSNGQFTGTF